MKRFPLRLCEVLEKEFVTIHGQQFVQAGWLLEKSNVDFARLLDLLRAPIRGPSPDAIVAIAKLLTDAGIAIGGAQAATLEDSLLKALNEAIAKNVNLYDPCLLDGEAEARRLAEMQCRVPIEPDEQAQLNRLLLEAAFPPEALARVDTVRLNSLFDSIHAMKGPASTHSALCLSGGGIRSASFALGVMQGLARCGVLERFDYLSTVSGGGYVGSWLTTWIHRHPRGLSGVVEELGGVVRTEAGNVPPKLEPEPPPLRFLRSYSYFLNPRSGLFSVDTWTWIGLYLRNLSLNWLAIVPLLLLVILAPRLYSAMMFFPPFFWTASVAAVLTLVCAAVNRPSVSDPAAPGANWRSSPRAQSLERSMARFKTQNWIIALGVFPLLIFAILLSLLLWGLPASTVPMSASQIWALLKGTPLAVLPEVVAFMGFGHLLIWGEVIVVASWLISVPLRSGRGWVKPLQELAAMLFAGAFAWAIISELAGYATERVVNASETFRTGVVSIHAAHLYAVLAVPALMLAALAGMTFFIGVVSKSRWVEDEDREWWARFGAWALIFVAAWAALGTIVVFGPVLLLESPRLLGALGGASGLVAVILGKSALSPATSSKDAASQGASRKAILGALLGPNLLATASVVFLAVLLAFLSLLASVALKELFEWLAADPRPTGAIANVLLELVGSDWMTHGCGHGTPWHGLQEVSVLDDPQLHLEIVCQTPYNLMTVVMIAVGLFLLAAGLLINLNKFSLHAAYRMRIVRTFLGASRGDERKPNPFTGFDPMDNVEMHQLQPGLLHEGDFVDLPRGMQALRTALIDQAGKPELIRLVQLMCSRDNDRSQLLAERLRRYDPVNPVPRSLQINMIESLNRVLEMERLDEDKAFASLQGLDAARRYSAHGNRIFSNRLLLESAFPNGIRKYAFPPPPPHKLVHVLNLTLNLVHGGRLAWQDRKAAPFMVSPMHAGSYYLGFRNSRDYGGRDGIAIGTAAAISGAAVSPNMGYSSSPVTAMLLTIFNVRLGWWLGNPGIAGASTHRRSEPKFSLFPLVAEALGLTDDRSPYVYLSDGGHFENTAIYEMVLRRCKLIVVSDAGADPKYQFGDLANAVRKIRIDLGIPIEFSAMPIRKREDCGEAGTYCAIGRIEYSAVDGHDAPDGVLLLFKPVLCGGEPRDVAHYAAQNPPFPQQPTYDQFFGETQFESYRQLGYFAARTVCRARPQDSQDKSWATSLVEAARAHIGNKGGNDDWIKPWLGPDV
jgi:hypothetical protein